MEQVIENSRKIFESTQPKKKTPVNSPHITAKRSPRQQRPNQNDNNFNEYHPSKQEILFVINEEGKDTYCRLLEENHDSTTTRKLVCTEIFDDRFRAEALDQLKNYQVIVAIITKNTLQRESFVFAISEALKDPTKKIIAVHNPQSCPFPGEDEWPKEISLLIKSIVISYSEPYAAECWKKITKKITRKFEAENTTTEVFLSHKQSSGQGIATTLFSQLERYYPKKVFLDVQAEFDLHDLTILVQNSKLFVFILSEGIFESIWCWNEFQAAHTAKKNVLVIRYHKFDVPDPLPERWKPLQEYFYSHRVLEYNPSYLKECTDLILKQVEELNKKPQEVSINNGHVRIESFLESKGEFYIRTCLPCKYVIEATETGAVVTNAMLPHEDSQLWSFVDGYFYNRKLSQVLEIKEGSTEKAATVVCSPIRHPASFQRWRIDGSGRIRNLMNDRVLDVRGSNQKKKAQIIAYPKGNNLQDNQRWCFLDNNGKAMDD